MLQHIACYIGLLLLFGGCQPKTTGGEGPNQKPNFLFIISDQLKYDALSIMGNPIIKTPNLDQLAKEGACFTNFYTPCAVCAPARASFLTGMTVENHGIRTNQLANGDTAAVAGLMKMPTIDEVLTGEGYVAEWYGKWHSPIFKGDVYQNPTQVTSNGVSIFAHGGLGRLHRDYLDKHVPRRELKEGELEDTMTKRPYMPDPIDHLYDLEWTEAVAYDGRRVQPDIHGELLIDEEHSITAYFGREVIDAIDRRKDGPFSITASFHFPHSPITPTKPYHGMYPVSDIDPPASIADDMSNSPYRSTNGRLDMPQYADPELIKYMISNYYGVITELDHWVGQIMQKLEEEGLADNTMVIFTSDHGEMLGAHGMREKNVFYEESAHVPLMIRFPGEIEPGTVVDGYVSGIDLFETITDYLGVGGPDTDGTSLRGLIEGTDTEHGDYVVTEWDYRGDVSPNYMIVKDNWKMFIPYSVESNVINALYNLEEDPHEMNNLLGANPDRGQYAEKVEELRADLISWLEDTGSARVEGVKYRKLY